MPQAVDGSQQRAARVAGAAFLLSFAIVVAVNFAVLGPLLKGTDPAQIARNILSHETLFRAGIAGNVVYAVLVVVLSAALYLALKPVGEGLALFAMLGRLVHGLTWLLTTLSAFTALRLLSHPEYAAAFKPDQLPVFSRLMLSWFDQYYVGLLFWSLGATVGAWLWLKSGYVPRALSVFGIAASAWCAVCTFVLFLAPDFPKVVNLWWFDSPMALFEIALSVVLVFRGLRPSAAAARAIAVDDRVLSTRSTA